MKYAYQVMIIGGISLAGELLNYLLPLPVPASVYGMLLLLICLCTKVIKLDQIQETADFMLVAMPLVFVGTWSCLDGIFWTHERFSAWNPYNLCTVHHGCYGSDRTDRADTGAQKER